jgi:hypothetical protein
VKATRKFLIPVALMFAGTMVCLHFHAAESSPTTSDYTVRYQPGLTLADVAGTRAELFAQSTGNITIIRRDCSVSARCRDALSSLALFLWLRTGEHCNALFDAALRLQPSPQQVVSAAPFTDRAVLCSEDSIVIPMQRGVTVL